MSPQYKVSSFERAVIKLLNAARINFQKEKSFSDLKHGHYRFDFFLPQYNILIEVHGEQHYKFTKHFYKDRSDFLKAQGRDREKISYCLTHGYTLFTIPFWEVENLKTAQDIFQEKFRTTNKFHNDYVWRIHQREKI